MTQNSTPVLFITFARPEYARQTFDAIKKAKPSKLYFYSNKARLDNPDELARNNQIRAYKDEIDWECNLLTFFRDEHVDIYTSLWSAIDWVFDNEEQAIILEEDCVPSLAFFDFCEQLLPKFKEDLRVWVISGNNFLEGFNPNGYDYIFSRYPYMYGWASWSDRWSRIERNNIPWKEIKSIKLHRQQYCLSKRKAKHIIKQQERNYRFIKKKPAWDYIFNFTIMKEGGLGIIPRINLVSNIGVAGEHSRGGGSLFHHRDTPNSEEYSINNPPHCIVPDFKYEQKFFNQVIYKEVLIHNRIIRKIKGYYGILTQLVKKGAKRFRSFFASNTHF